MNLRGRFFLFETMLFECRYVVAAWTYVMLETCGFVMVYVMLMQCYFPQQKEMTSRMCHWKRERTFTFQSDQDHANLQFKSRQTFKDFIFYTLLKYCNNLFRERHVHLSVFSCLGIRRVFFIRNQYYQIFLFSKFVLNHSFCSVELL